MGCGASDASLERLIAAKRAGDEHSLADLRRLASAVADGAMSDVQVSAWLMAAAIRGLSDRETINLTQAMRDVGACIARGRLCAPRADKHSTGGVGDKVTLIAVPLAAACGVPVLKLTGRALGFSGGTADKLEAVPGVRTELTLDEAARQVRAIGAAIVTQTPDIAPADRRMYAIRDVTSTVDSIPLIAASIMSKKLAAGADALVLDVKVGRGTFVASLSDARRLARLMVCIGEADGVRTEALISDMDRPLGRCVGCLIEVEEALRALESPSEADGRLLELSLSVAERMLALSGRFPDAVAAAQVDAALRDGSGARKLAELLRAQGGDLSRLTEPLLGGSVAVHTVVAARTGAIVGIEPRAIGRLARELQGPRSGVVLDRVVGDTVEAGDTVARVYAETGDAAVVCAEAVGAAYRYGADVPEPSPVIVERVTSASPDAVS